MIETIYSNPELYHFGIKDMKWGVRRYQLPDGTWTEEGKKRRRINESDDYKKYSELKKKDIREMSNKDLEDINRRDNLQSNYKKNNKTSLEKIKDYVASQGDKLVTAITAIIIADGARAVTNAIKKGVSKQ